MEAKERSRQIVEYMKSHKQADITILSDMFKVSEMTIRRDLDQLEKENILFRVHGGARLISSDSYIPPMDDRFNLQKEEKMKIGKYAASLIRPGDVISMDDSSTTYAMIPFLSPDLTVVTNYMNVVSALIQYEKTDIILLGGKIRKSTSSTTGKDVEHMLANYHVGRVFMSAKAMDPVEGIFDASPDLAETKKAFMSAGTKVYFLCDHTKLNTFAFSKICDLKEVSTIIMDACDDVKKEQLNLKNYCEKKGVQLVLV